MAIKNFQKYLPYYLKLVVNIVYFFVVWVYAHLQLFYRKIHPRPPKSLDNEIILITGSAQGIGQQIALYIANHFPSAKLVLWDCDEKGNNKSAEMVRNLGASAAPYTIDITDRISVEKLAVQVTKEVGAITVLVNNAGTTGIGSIFAQSPEIIEKTIKLNLLAHFWTLRSFLPQMIERNHGHILTISSLGAYGHMKYAVPYCASKHGVRGLILSLQSELRDHQFSNKPTDKIKFTTVSPYFVKTQMTDRVRLNCNLASMNQWWDAAEVAKRAIEGMRRDEENVVLPSDKEFLFLLAPLMPSLFRNKLEDWISHKTTFEK